MKFVFGKQDMTTLDRAQERCCLLTNGLGGYFSVSAAFSVTRCDQGVLVAARTAPNDRWTLVHRLSEKLAVGEEAVFLSTQGFADGAPPEEGYRRLSSFTVDGAPEWLYHVGGVQVRRRCAMEYEKNTAAVVYDIENRADAPCTLTVRLCPPRLHQRDGPPHAAGVGAPRLPGRRPGRAHRGGPRRLLL